MQKRRRKKDGEVKRQYGVVKCKIAQQYEFTGRGDLLANSRMKTTDSVRIFH